MAWDKTKKDKIMDSATCGVVSSLIKGNSIEIQRIKPVLKLMNFKVEPEVIDEFTVYCKAIGSDKSKELVGFMKQCIDENQSLIEEFKKRLN